ncbi:MAG: apolipoprotein N-acyltransferase [Planctomyces sp.]|nr:apolipoprotein N-acyltransferase [Planctomyces sp.]
MAEHTGAPSAGDPSGMRPDLERIIASGRKPERIFKGSLRGVILLAVASLILLYCSFTPIEFGTAAWLVLIPLGQLVRVRYLPRWTYVVLTGLAFIWSVATLQWMRLGHVTMYGAMFALAAYLSLYFPAFLVISRRLVATCRLPAWLVMPVTWVALEYARAYLLTGFSWYYLGHSQYRWTTLVQISDLTGAYGVSFIVALISSVIACTVPERWIAAAGLDSELAAPGSSKAAQSARWLPFVGPVTAAVVLLVAIGYGTLRLSQTMGTGSGPTFALIQGNFSPELKHDPSEWMQRYRIHDNLTRYCVELQPQFIVWPETMFPWPEQSIEDGLKDEEIAGQIPPELLESASYDTARLISKFRSGEVRSSLADHSKMVGSNLLIGLESHEISRKGLRAFNSVAFVRPDLGYVSRYDKMHRVIFGEYIPLKDVFPWLSNLTPFGPNFGIAAGQQPTTFEYGKFCVAPLICFEDTVPHVVRHIASQPGEDGSGVDVLVNLTNDAWFRGSSELDQHLITSSFRCVEYRMPMVRAVNGGISAFIDGNGEIRDPAEILMLDAENGKLKALKGMRDPETGRWRRQFSGIIYGQVPLDERSSLYLRIGDVFAGGCLLLTLLGVVGSFLLPASR